MEKRRASGKRREDRKKSYVRPRIDSEEIFETLALTCCKVNGAGCTVPLPGTASTVSTNAS